MKKPREQHDRFRSTLNPRPLLFLAIAKQCGRQELYRRVRLRKRPGKLWCELRGGQEQLIRLYEREERYRDRERPRSMNRVTLHRQVAAYELRGWLIVYRRPVQDRSGHWRRLPNRYELTPVGIRYIKKSWKGAHVPLVTTDV